MQVSHSIRNLLCDHNAVLVIFIYVVMHKMLCTTNQDQILAKTLVQSTVNVDIRLNFFYSITTLCKIRILRSLNSQSWEPCMNIYFRINLISKSSNH